MLPPLPLPRIDEADVALATLLMVAARHERTTQQREEKERGGVEGGKRELQNDTQTQFGANMCWL